MKRLIDKDKLISETQRLIEILEDIYGDDQDRFAEGSIRAYQDMVEYLEEFPEEEND